MQIELPPTSLLDLLMRQQTHGDAGIRLVFNEELARPMSLTRNPYHFCAVNGYSGLAAFLYMRGVSYEDFGDSIRVAAFLGDGINSSTPWQKSFDVSPADAALLAGHATTAQLLRLMECGTPLAWTRSLHHKFPAQFRAAVKPIMEALMSSHGFVTLPGPARVLVVNDVMSSMARSIVYDKLPEDSICWESMTERESQEELELYAAAAKLPLQLNLPGEPSVKGVEGDNGQDEVGVRYHFRIAQARRPRQRLGLYLLLRSSVAVAAVHTARMMGVVTVSLPASAIAAAAFLAPFPALIALAGVHAGRRP